MHETRTHGLRSHRAGLDYAVVLTGLLVLAFAWPAAGQIKGQLTVTPNSVSFLDANPTTTPSIFATTKVEISLFTAVDSKGTPWSVTALAAGDLMSGSDSIGIANVSWTTAGPGGSGCVSCACLAGTASSVFSQPMLTGFGSTVGAVTCTKIFRLVNSWSYTPGQYAQVLTITLTSP